MVLAGFVTDLLPGSLQLFLITAAVPARSPLQGSLAERGAYVKRLEKLRKLLCLFNVLLEFM
jgi:hypothetical protein